MRQLKEDIFVAIFILWIIIFGATFVVLYFKTMAAADQINDLQYKLSIEQGRTNELITKYNDISEEIEQIQVIDNAQSTRIQIAFNSIAHTNEENNVRFNDILTTISGIDEAMQNLTPTSVQLPTTWNGPKLTRSSGVCQGPSGRETYYNLDMSGCVAMMRVKGYNSTDYPYWVRSDGCKMLGPYIMVAANLRIRPKGTILETSLGWAIVCDTGGFVRNYPYGLDIATNW